MSWAAVAAAGVGAAGSYLGSKSGGNAGNVQSTSASTPWAGLQSPLANLYQMAQGHAYAPAFSYTPSQYTTQYQNLTAQKALSPNSLVGQSQGVLGNTIAGNYLDPNTNPSFKSAIDDALGMAKSQFAGQYGGAAGQNLQNSGYQESLARGLGATATNAYMNQYNTERQNQLQATQLAPSMDYANINPLSGIGAQQEQTSLNQYMSPWQNISLFGSALQPGSQFGTTTSQQPYFTNPAASALGGALGGYQLYNAFSGGSQQQPSLYQNFMQNANSNGFGGAFTGTGNNAAYG